jgi:hypothetical protein
MDNSIASTATPPITANTSQTGVAKGCTPAGSAHPPRHLRSVSVRIPRVHRPITPRALPASTLPSRHVAIVLCLAILCFWPWGAAAQFEPAATGGSGEIAITAPWFGVGGVVRPGDWTGIRLALTDVGDRQRDVIIRITMPDPDGDSILWERIVSTNPGVTQPLWMYLQLPWRFGRAETLTVTSYAAIEQAGPGAAPGGAWSHIPGPMLGSTRIAPRQVVSKTTGLLGIVGARPMGLTRYAGIPQVEHLPAGHERIELVQRLDPEILPDRWIGLAPFETIVWNEASPAALGTERAQALREWIMRGGHLVVVLPRLGQVWTDQVNNPLHDLMPLVTVRRVEGVDLAPYAPLISKAADMPMPRSEILHVFAPLEGAAPADAACILAGPPDAATGQQPCIVVRRSVGTGAVTLIGLDVASRWMTDRGLPDADLFWHRVLGKRGELISGREQDVNSPVHLSRDIVTFDRDIPEQIAKTGRAAAGVLIGFVVFIAYWLVAGPIGYAVLKRRGLARHGWLAFVAAAAVFTGIAWGGATAIKPQQIEATHLTFLDHIYGQPVQRTRTWASLLVPEYGEVAVMLGDPGRRDAQRFHNLIAPWEPDTIGRQGFPDAREYRIESRAPDHVVVPVRATVKQFQFDWAGGPRWSMPRPIAAADGSETSVRLVQRNGQLCLEGVLVHDLPQPMRNVTLLVVTGQRNIARSLHLPGSRAMLSHVFAVKPADWAPGMPLDLSQTITDLEPVARNPAYATQGQFFQDFLSSGTTDTAEALGTESQMISRLTALALFSQIEPPETRTDLRLGQSPRLAARKSSHGWDLGTWFAQPCIIIIGHVGDSAQGAPSPTPIYVNMVGGLVRGRGIAGSAAGGAFREVPSSGRTVVRWVYPLGDNPPGFPESSAATPGADDSGGEQPSGG